MANYVAVAKVMQDLYSSYINNRLFELKMVLSYKTSTPSNTYFVLVFH